MIYLEAEIIYRKDKPNWVWSEFEVTVPMSTYLVAYSINDFEYKESVVKMANDVLFRIWARRDALDQVQTNSNAVYVDIFDNKLIFVGGVCKIHWTESA